MTTSPSNPLSLDRAFRNALDAARGDKSLGAGQRAALVHALEIERINARWGVPLFPAEPISQVIATLQLDYGLYTILLQAWQPENHPFADTRITTLGDNRALILDYLDTLYSSEIPGIYTQAGTPDELDRLLTHVPETPGRIDYAALKAKIDIVDYIGRYVQLRRVGTRYAAKCPFHDDDTPSFVVFPGDKRFHCFGCQAHGDVIDFARRIGQDVAA